MGVAIYMSDGRSYPIVGATELARVWRPLIDARGLHFVDAIVTGGLSLDAENYAEVLGELEALFACLDEHDTFARDRRARVLQLIRANPPGGPCKVYLG